VENGGAAVKLAVRLRSPRAVKVKLRELLTTLPFSVQLAKVYPVRGTHVRVALDPQLTVTRPTVDPPFAGELAVLRV
jgi:hypothetical protein